jgi:YD repeat-containing protein
MSRTGKSYGRYEYGAEIKQGKTNKLSFTIWLTPIDLQHQVRVPSLTTSETVVKTPLIPGLELRLPPNASIYDEDHRPVTQISITPIPLDRPPFPLPFIKVPIYFTIQPGGAYIYVKDPKGPKGARLIYPNAGKLQPGMPFAFWNYNPDQNGWYAYGQGKVGPTGENIIPDPGVVIYEFSGAMVGGDGAGPGTGPSAGGGGGAGGGHPRNANGSGGDPVDLSSGLFVYNKTDFVLPDVLPLVLTRTYRPNDSWKRPFGIGTTHPYEMFVGGNGFSFGTTPYIDLFMPDGSRIHFDGVGNESGCCTSYKHTTSGTSWYGAVIGPADGGTAWQIRRRDGMIYKFHYSDGLVNPACQALAGIIDRYGNTITIDRNWDGVNCTINRITSPNGRYIDFLSDTSNRIIKATDNSGRFVQYSYDGSGRLATVTDVNGGVTTFTYNDQAQMTSIQDARGIVSLVNP